MSLGAFEDCAFCNTGDGGEMQHRLRVCLTCFTQVVASRTETLSGTSISATVDTCRYDRFVERGAHVTSWDAAPRELAPVAPARRNDNEHK